LILLAKRFHYPAEVALAFYAIVVVAFSYPRLLATFPFSEHFVLILLKPLKDVHELSFFAMKCRWVTMSGRF